MPTETEISSELAGEEPPERQEWKTHVDVIKVTCCWNSTFVWAALILNAQVYNVVLRKLQNSELAYAFVGYMIWMAFYIGAAVMQRDAAPSESLQSAMQNLMMSNYRDPVSLEMKGLLDIKNVVDFWDWHMINLVPMVIGVTKQRPNMILNQNRLTSGFQMIQRRSVRRLCNFGDSKFNTFAKYCYGLTLAEGLIGDVDTSNFLGSDNTTVYTYEKVDIGFGLSDVGYFQRFNNMDLTTLQNQLQILKNNQWINGGTRFVRTDFVTYNPNSGLFILVMLKIQFTNNGNVLSTYDSETLPATFYYTWTDTCRMILEIITVALWGAHAFFALKGCLWNSELGGKDLDIPRPDWKTPMLIMKSFQLVFFLVIFGMWGRIINDPFLSSLIITNDKITVPSGQLNFVGVSLAFQVYWIMHGVNILMSVLIILCFFNMNSGISQLSTTLHIMAGNLFQFGLVFFLLMSAFMLMAHLLFGNLLLEYSQLQNSFLSLFDILLGGGDYFGLEDVDSIGAPLFYYPFLFIMVFVVFNITIAIIMDGYVVMQEQRKQQREGDFKDVVELPIWTQMGHGLMRMFPVSRLLPRRWRRIETDGQPLDRFEGPRKREILLLLEEFVREKDRAIPIEELKRRLADKNITEQSIEAIFDRYSGWVPMPADEQDEDTQNANSNLIDKAIGFRQSLQELVKDQDELNQKIDYILQNWTLAMGK